MSAPQIQRLLLEVVGETRAPIELPRSGVLTIGSDAARADLVLDGQGVADAHCAIGRSKTGVFAIKDLGSQHGTIVNGARIQGAPLAAGDVIVLGSRRLRVIDPEAPQAIDVATPEPTSMVPAPAAAARGYAGPPAAASASSAPAAVPPSARIKSFRLQRLLGRGGMGEVHLAVQEPLERPVALKLLSQELSRDADFVRRFLAEARAAAALNHPNVVVVYDAGEDQGRHYLAMEYMERGNLESRVAKEGALPWREALDALIEAARGLQYAEQKNIVHRDIKPANLMQNAAGTIKIADLGLAAHLDAEATQEGDRKIFGTPHFISPEQARGERVDARSDLYSLGATAYRLLSGHTPFEGATTRDILRGHFTEAPRPLGELAPAVPAALAPIVHRLLQKRPEDRYPSASALLADLERLRSPGAHPGSGPAAAAHPHKKSLAPLFLALVSAVAAIAASIWILGKNQPPQGNEMGNGENAAPREVVTAPDVERAPDPGRSTPERTRGEEDAELKVRELQAEVAYRDLPSADADPAVRRDALRELSLRFAGTTVASRIQPEIEALGTRIESERNAAGERASAAATVLAQMSSALGGDPLDVAGALRALAAVPGQDAFAEDPDFQEKRRALASQVVARGADAARRVLEEGERAGENGDFEALEARLKQVSAAGDIPEALDGLDLGTLAGSAGLAELKRTADARLVDLPALRERIRTSLTSADARAVATGFGGPQGLERELAALDLDAAIARLASLESVVHTDEQRAFVSGLKQDLERGRQSLAVVARELKSGNWRRRSVLDPRKGRGQARNAVTADASGVELEGDGGTESVPWSAFGSHPKELHHLFYERLSRDYTPDELSGIAALMRATAVSAAIAGTQEMLQIQRSASFSDSEVREVLEGFQLARGWAVAPQDKEALAREERAAELFARALNLASSGQWTSAVANLERVRADGAETLFFRLLSEGPGGG